MPPTDKDTFVQELDNLRSQVPGLSKHPYRAAQDYWTGVRANEGLRIAASNEINGLSASLGRTITSGDYDSPEIARIRANNEALRNVMGAGRGLSSSGMSRTGAARAKSQDARWNQGFTPKTSMMGGGGSAMGGDVYNAIPRFYDPLEYWDISGLPWNVADEGHRHKLHKWLRLYYATHYLVPILVDIFTRFPLVGMHLECLSGDTLVVTKDGTKAISQLDGQEVEVLDGRGQWVKAPFKSYGTKYVHEITMKRNGRIKTIRATDTHRWIVETTKRSHTVRARSGPGLRKEVTTGNLKSGMTLASTYAQENHSTFDEWTVVKVQYNIDKVEVYCPTVSTTGTFVLDGNILTGNSPDPALTTIYEDIFLDQLKYEDFLVSLGREFWLVGEAFPLGSFDADLGVWEHEELINPEDVVIDNFPLLDSQQLKIVPPDYLRRIAQTRSPAREWYMLQQNYEDLIPYLLKGEHIPISPVMLRQVGNKLNDWDDHGTPMLLRGLRTLLHEEKLLASQDAIAERLYSPFILAKLGIMDMGEGLPPWVPNPEELQAVRDDIDIAMASDFRVMVHHFGLEMSSVFGREQMPRLGDDFDRIERRLMEVFGINPSLLSAGSNSQPYASSALQAEFMNQMLRTFQKVLKDHFKFRASVVAEAQGHYAYERKGASRVPIYENVVSYDEDGNKIITKEHKLLVPTLNMETFDLRDEATERQFLMGLRAAGLQIPDDKLMIGVTWKDDDYVTQYNRDIMKKTISQQRAKMDTYIALVIQGLPVPMDLKYEVESVLQGGTGPEMGGPGGPGGDMGAGAGAGGGMPPGGDMGGGAPGGGGPESTFGGQMPSPPGGLGPGPGMQPPGGGPPPMAPGGPAGGNSGPAPQISNERRPGLTYNTNTVPREEWPEHMQKRADVIEDSYQRFGWFLPEAFEDVGEGLDDSNSNSKMSAILDEPDNGETDDSATWILKANQEIAQYNGETIIVESNKHKRIVPPVEPTKKYSIIDTLYDGEYDKLRDEELNELPESEST